MGDISMGCGCSSPACTSTPGEELGLAALVRSVVHLGGLLNMSGLSCRFRGVPDSSRPKIREGERSRLHQGPRCILADPRSPH